MQAADTDNITLTLEHWARHCPQGTALVSRGQPISYAVLDAWVWRVCARFQQCGVKPGQLVAYTFTSELLLLLAMLATARIGATAFCIPKSRTARQKQAWLNQLQARHFFSDRAEDCSVPPGVTFSTLSFTDLQHKPQSHQGLLDPQPTAPMLIALSSGSTGQPKRIPVHHAVMKGRAQVFAQHPSYGREQTLCCVTSLEFSSIQTYALCTLLNQGRYVLDGAELPFAHYGRWGPMHLRMSVFHLHKLLDLVDSGVANGLKQLAHLSTGSAPVSMALRHQVRDRLGVNLHVTYGTNECLLISAALPPHVHTTAGTVGLPAHGVQLEVVDEALNPLPAGQKGQVRVKSPALVRGIVQPSEPGAPHASVYRHGLHDGWFYPGDFAQLNPDGQLIHLGRTDHLMIRNGINIEPAEIELAMLDFPGVAAVQALPLPHERFGDQPVCVVEPQHGQLVDLPKLEAFAQERLGYKAPVQFRIHPIVRTAQGKVDFKALRALFANPDGPNS